jgi:hypothetical protein
MSKTISGYKPGQGYYGELPDPDPAVLAWLRRNWEPEAPHLLVRLAPRPSGVKREGGHATR